MARPGNRRLDADVALWRAVREERASRLASAELRVPEAGAGQPFLFGTLRQWGAVLRLMRATGSAGPLVLLVEAPLRRLVGWLEGRVFFVDQRENVSINWRHPLAVPVVALSFPVGLLVSLVLHTKMWLKRPGVRQRGGGGR